MPDNSSPSRLLVDGRDTPLAISRDAVSLSWRPGSGSPTGVVLEVGSTPDLLEGGAADRLRVTLAPGTTSYVWESPAVSRERLFWRVGESSGDTVAWSESARFERPPLGDWTASWIGDSAWAEVAPRPLPVFTRRFDVTDPVHSARLYLAAAGVVAVRINGSAASAEVLAPGYATYAASIPAVAWDVTGLLVTGENEIELELGGGQAQVEPVAERYSKLVSSFLIPRVMVSLEVEHERGATRIVSDASWSVSASSITSSHWYGGEDAVGGPRPTDSGRTLVVYGDEGLHRVRWTLHPPIRQVDTLAARDSWSTRRGSVVVDFGVNIAGWQRIRLVNAPAGRRVVMRPAELLDDDRGIDQWSTGTPIFDTYTTGGGDESWHPSLTYHGFRYLEVEADPDVLDRLTVDALVLHVSNAASGALELADPVLDQLHTIIRRSIQGNMYSVFTDCPHREKLGWIEQLYLCFGALARNFDVHAHIRDEIYQLLDAQLPSGAVTSTVPEFSDFSGAEFAGDPNAFREDPNWGAALVHLPWLVYREYGDELPLRESWVAVTRYLDYLSTRAQGGILDFGLGDWIALDGTTPRWLVATAGYKSMLETAARVAEIIGEDASVFRARLGETRAALVRRALEEPSVLGSQGALALLLEHVELSDAERSRALDRLVSRLDTDGRFTLGENALPSLIRVLHDAGQDELLDRVVRNPDAPGYGYQIARGATSLSETWTAVSGPEGEGSQNHFMLGMIHDWLHADLAGLDQHADSVGWEHLLIAPTPLAGLSSASTRYLTPRGTAAVAWSRGPHGASITVTVPPTARATVRSPWDVSLDGGPRGRTFELGSGTWELRA